MMRFSVSMFLGALLALMSHSAIASFQCAKWTLAGNDDGWVRVNGEKVTSQKVVYLAEKGDETNTKYDMGLMPARDGNMYGFQFIKRDGKAWLNVELLRANMNAPRIIGTFDCVKVKD